MVNSASSAPRPAPATRSSAPARSPKARAQGPANPADRTQLSAQAREKPGTAGSAAMIGGLNNTFGGPKPARAQASTQGSPAHEATKTVQKYFSVYDNPGGGDKDGIISRKDIDHVAQGDFNRDKARQQLKQQGVAEKDLDGELNRIQTSARYLNSHQDAFNTLDGADAAERPNYKRAGRGMVREPGVHKALDGRISRGDVDRAAQYQETDRNAQLNPDSRFGRINEIARMPEEKRVERNQEITRTYNEQAKDIRDMVGADGGANWLAYATQASDGVGQVMQGKVTGTLGIGPTEGAKEALGQGNRKVFEEVSPQAERFIQNFRGDKTKDPAKWNEFAKQFGPDQGKLRDSFHAYYDAMFETDTKKKQEDVLKGNLLLGEHEQRRLDPQIDRAFQEVPGPNILSPLAKGSINDKIRIAWPGYNHKTAQDVVPSHTEGNRNLDYNQIQDQDLRAGLDKWRHEGSKNTDPNSLKGTNATDWSDLGERMYFISEMFRNTQMDPNLYRLNSAN